MEYAQLYRPGPIAPVAKPGENILVFSQKTYNLFKVAFVEPLPLSPALTIDNGQLPTGAQLNAIDTSSILDMSDGQLAQLRFKVLDDINVQLNQPSQLVRFTNKNKTATVDLFTHKAGLDHLSEFFIFQTQRPYLYVSNPTGYTLAKTRVAFWGFKYVLSGADGVSDGQKINPIAKYGTIEAVEQAAKAGTKFTFVPTTGYGGD